ncbi:MAG: CHAT domain-containing tetratricopeptide repeat protein [Wenzhouxiangellaceae bacterium]
MTISNASAMPVPRQSPDGLFLDGVGECAMVANQGADTMIEALAADGAVIMRAASWRGREGRYVVAPPTDAVDVRITALGRDSISAGDIHVDACPEALDLSAARALAGAIDLRLAAYFGAQSDSGRIGALLDQALAGIPADKLPGWRADVLFETAEWHRDAGRREDAALAYADALALYRRVDDLRGQAAALNSLGLVAWRQGRPVEATPRFEQALAIRRTLGEAFASAAILNNLGLLAAESGDRDAALEHYQQALEIFQNGIELRTGIDAASAAGLANQVSGDGDLGSALNTLNNLAQLYWDTGQPAVAERYWRNYLAFEAHVPEALAVAQARHNLGVLLYEQGRLDEALRLLLNAKDSFDAAGAGRWQAEVRVALSLLYLEFGDHDGAWAYAEQAIALEMDDPRARAVVLRQSGRIALDLGHADAALDALRTAASLLDGNAPPGDLGALDSDLAQTELKLGRLDAALKRQQHNLERLERSGFTGAVAQARSLLGEILHRRGDTGAAIRALEQAQAAQQRIGARLAELETLERLGRMQQTRDPRAAIATHDRALRLLADPRVRRLPEVRRAGFRARYRVLYERQIGLLLEADRVDEAWSVGEQARAGDLMALREERRRGQRNPARRQALDRHAALLAQLHLYTAGLDGGVPPAHEIQRIRAELDRLETSLRSEAGDAPPPSPEAVRAGLAPHQRLLSFVLGEHRGWVWASSADRTRVAEIRDVATLRADVSELLRQLRHPRNAIGLVHRRVKDIRARALAPVREMLVGAGEVLIQPDRELHALPFTLLWPDNAEAGPVPGTRRVLAAAPAPLTAMPPDATMLVLADPGWNEPGHGDPMYPETSLLTRLLRDSALARLPGTRREAEAIAALGGDRVRVNLKLGRAATRSFVVDGGMRGYPLLHIATHGLVDLEYPELSALLLADGNAGGPAFLRPTDIARLDLDASLVVLSGCDTGHGRVFAGSGAFSLARPFLIAGADQVLASLWKVDDHRTAQFMARFYHHLFGEQRDAAEALALTRQWMRQQPGNAHPYYWAGFVLTAAGISSPEPVPASSELQSTAN